MPSFNEIEVRTDGFIWWLFILKKLTWSIQKNYRIQTGKGKD
jgi:hypothetical protein